MYHTHASALGARRSIRSPWNHSYINVCAGTKTKVLCRGIKFSLYVKLFLLPRFIYFNFKFQIRFICIYVYVYYCTHVSVCHMCLGTRRGLKMQSGITHSREALDMSSGNQPWVLRKSRECSYILGCLNSTSLLAYFAAVKTLCELGKGLNWQSTTL